MGYPEPRAAQISGLSPEVLADVRARAPDIDTDFVLVANSGWKEDGITRLLGPDARPTLLIMVGILLLPVILVVVLHIRPRLRNRKLIALIARQT